MSDNKEVGAELLTISQAASRVQVHPNTVRKWIANGELPVYRYGSRIVRIRPKDLELVFQTNTENN